MVNPTRTLELKLEIKDLLFIAFQQINSRAFTNLACLVKEIFILLNGSVLLSISILRLACDLVFRNNFGRTKH